jgi:phosphoribosyl 1,2-cyclic phosphodiesterase
VESGGKFLLVDAGLSAKQLKLRLAKFGVTREDLSGILLTHEHGDHVRGLDVFLRGLKVPILASTMTGRVVQEGLREAAQWVAFEGGQSFTWEGFEIATFRLPHDAVDPVGYVIGDADHRLGVATDLGHVSDAIKETLAGVAGLVVEANYEWDLLEADVRRPFSTKQRISSKHGHLSNEQAAELVAELIPQGLKRVVLGHLSSDCNCPHRAVEAVREKTGEHALEICVAEQHEVTPWQKLEVEIDPAFYGELFGGG